MELLILFAILGASASLIGKQDKRNAERKDKIEKAEQEISLLETQEKQTIAERDQEFFKLDTTQAMTLGELAAGRAAGGAYVDNNVAKDTVTLDKAGGEALAKSGSAYSAIFSRNRQDVSKRSELALETITKKKTYAQEIIDYNKNDFNFLGAMGADLFNAFLDVGKAAI